MWSRSILGIGIVSVSLLQGQPTQEPLRIPPELPAVVRRATLLHYSLPAKLQAINSLLFTPAEQGGFGIAYDNEYTRTVEEVWRDRKANCLSLTAFFVACCRVENIEVRYAEALNTNRWRRVKGTIRFERHVVALARTAGGDDLVADFLPGMRRRLGFYVVDALSASTFLALFHANRAVEQMDQGDLEMALETARHATSVDPKVSMAWNILGVILQKKDRTDEAEVCFRRSLSLDARDMAALGNLENLFRRQGRFQEAIVLRNRGLEVRKRDPYFQAFLADEAMEVKDLQEAEHRIKAALKIYPNEPEFHLLYARIHMEKGELDKASADLAAAQKYASPEEKARFENKMEALKQRRDLEGK